MSDTTTPEATQPVTFETLDPAALLLDSNIRLATEADESLIVSVREHGVLSPITVVRSEEGDRVRYGHRRTLAAIEAGRQVPAIIISATHGIPGEVERLVTQWAENEYREGLTEGDRVSAVEQLSLLGISATQIAKRLHITKATVTAAKTVAKSAAATEVVQAAENNLTLDEAAVIAEFDDNPDDVAELVRNARIGRLNHAAQQLRDDRAEQAKKAAAAEALTATGVTVIERGVGVALTSLVDEAGEVLTAETHAACPGHAAYLSTRYAYLDPTTGQPVADYDDADDTEWDGGDDEAEDEGDAEQQVTGSATAPRPEWGGYIGPVYVCTESRRHSPRYTNTSDAPKTKLADLSPDEAEARRAERRDVIASNKAWKSATTVRLGHLRTLLARKTAPKGTPTMLLAALSTHPHIIESTGGNQLAAKLMGLPEAHYGRSPELIALVDEVTDQRATVLSLGLVLCGFEDTTSEQSWRSVNPGTKRYLTFIESTGYTLSEVERRACGMPATEALSE